MPKVTGRPDFHLTKCVSVRASTTFSLGRARLAEDIGVSGPRLKRGDVYVVESYPAGGKDFWLSARVTSRGQGVEGSADEWTLELVAGVKAAVEPAVYRADGGAKPLAFLKRMGKIGLVVDLTVNALFLQVDPSVPQLPQMPVSIDHPGGVFSHIVGVTLAKIDDTQRVLYEVSLRRDPGSLASLGVGFSYRRILDHEVYDAMLVRAGQLLDLAVKPVDAKAPAPASSDAPKVESASPASSTPMKGSGDV